MYSMKLNEHLGIYNGGDDCRVNGSCGHYSPNPKYNRCNPTKCLEARLRLIDSTVGDN